MTPILDPRLDSSDPIYRDVLKKFPNYSWRYVKCQHYVPVFYQKLFSCGINKLGEPLIRHCNKKETGDCIIQEFCKSEFTYGKNCHMESAYGWSEDNASKIIKDIVNNPRNNHFKATFSWEVLIEFLASLDDRSIRTITSQKQFIKTNEEIIYKIHGITDYSIDTHLSDIPNLFVSLDDAWIYESYNFDYCVLINNSDVPLITSDCPLCIYNPKYVKLSPVPQYDKATEGAIWYLPVSPKIGFLVYDDRHYEIKKHRETIHIKEQSQINELNKMVACNSYEELIYNSSEWDDYAKELLAYMPGKSTAYQILNTFGRGFFIKEPLALDFIRINSKPIDIENAHERHDRVTNYFYNVLEQIIYKKDTK